MERNLAIKQCLIIMLSRSSNFKTKKMFLKADKKNRTIVVMRNDSNTLLKISCVEKSVLLVLLF